MSTEMNGIYQESLFSKAVALSIAVPENSRYRVLSDVLPWREMADIANKYRGEKISLIMGRSLDMRKHLGAYVAQSMNGWTDRQTEEMLKYHAGVRILCGLQESVDSSDRTSIEKFRNMIGPKGAEELNGLIVRHAAGAGFTGSELCASDTTVQEAPIEHPTEVGHMKKISEKLKGIGQKLKSKIKGALNQLTSQAQDIFTEIRLFTRGKASGVMERKKKLSRQLHQTVVKMLELVKSNLEGLPRKARDQARSQVDLYEKMLGQIIQWIKTGKHPAGKLISLWNQEARAITRGKVSRAVEFGRRWIITRLLGGYVIGAPTSKLGGDADVKIADEVLIGFLNTFGEVPESFVYDRGGDGPKNHEILEGLGVQNDCIFRKGSEKMDVDADVFEMARRERALSEASIATLKSSRYGFNKPRAKLPQSCTLKGQTAMFGFNSNLLFRDVVSNWGMAAEIS